MTRPTPCNSVEPRLTAYLLGDLPDAEAATVRTHLETCPACQEAVRHLEPTLDLLRSAFAAAAMTAPQIEKGRREVIRAARQRSGFLEWLYAGHPVWLKAAALVGVSLAILWVWRSPVRGKATGAEPEEMNPGPAVAAEFVTTETDSNGGPAPANHAADKSAYLSAAANEPATQAELPPPAPALREETAEVPGSATIAGAAKSAAPSVLPGTTVSVDRMITAATAAPRKAVAGDVATTQAFADEDADDDLTPTSVGDSAIASLDLAYEAPAAGRQLALHTELGPSPCRPDRRLLLIGVTAGVLPAMENGQAAGGGRIASRGKRETDISGIAMTMPALPAGGLRHLQLRADFNPQRVRNARILAITPAGSPCRARAQQAVVELGSLAPGERATVVLDLETQASTPAPFGIVRVSFLAGEKTDPVVGGAVLSRDREQPDWDRTSVNFRLAACAAELALARHEPGQDATARIAILTTQVKALTAKEPDNPRVTQLLRWLIAPADRRHP